MFDERNQHRRVKKNNYLKEAQATIMKIPASSDMIRLHRFKLFLRGPSEEHSPIILAKNRG
jgi:hypothetical protein